MRKSEKIFRLKFNNAPNFITPNVIEYGNVTLPRTFPYFCYELSWGSGMFNIEKLYGVTVLKQEANGKILKTGFSKCCHSLQEANAYISHLGGMEMNVLMSQDESMGEYGDYEWQWEESQGE